MHVGLVDAGSNILAEGLHVLGGDRAPGKGLGDYSLPYSLTVCGFGFFCVGYDGKSASQPTNAYATTYSSNLSISRTRRN